MPRDRRTVFMVEDDYAVRDALGLLLGLRGYAVAPFADAESFLSALREEWRGCLLLDIRMPGMSGLEMQQQLLQRKCALPVIVMTGHGSIETAREAFRADAVDFLEKPLDHERLMTAIDEAFERDADRYTERGHRLDYERLLGVLTPREREIMDLVVAGMHNRDIARGLRISPRTVEVHKGRMMSKLGVRNVPDLVKLSLGRSAPQ